MTGVLWAGEGFGSWLLNVSATTVLAFLLTGALLTPVAKWVRRQLDPRSEGGLGDIPDAEGVPAYQRLQSESQSRRPDVR